MSGSSNCARARLMSSCMNSSSSIRASFFASAVRESARRTSSIERRDFFPPPDAVWHCQNEERERQIEVSYAMWTRERETGVESG